MSSSSIVYYNWTIAISANVIVDAKKIITVTIFEGGPNEGLLFNHSQRIIEPIRLRDYAEYHLNISCQYGTLILRSVFDDFNNDSQSYQAKDQFMFGIDDLVASVYTYQSTLHTV